MTRNKTIDAFRGLIMIIMAIDHASYFVINTHFYEGFDFITRNHTLLSFLTRFVTHLCAPGFFFLLGFAAYRKYLKDGSSKSLIYRGIFIIILQLTLSNYAWNLKSPMTSTYIGVLFCLGSSLIILAFLMPLVNKYGHLIGLSLIILTQYVITSNLIPNKNILLAFFFIPGQYENIFILYVIAPWLGLALIGSYLSAKKEIPYLLLGISLLILFMAIRYTSTFGNTQIKQESLISFFNLCKYPPSISFISLTMGINFLVIFLLSKIKNTFKDILIVYGKEALLFYVLHLYLFYFIDLVVKSESYITLFITWLIGVVLLYFPCKYYNLYKMNLFFKEKKGL